MNLISAAAASRRFAAAAGPAAAMPSSAQAARNAMFAEVAAGASASSASGCACVCAHARVRVRAHCARAHHQGGARGRRRLGPAACHSLPLVFTLSSPFGERAVAPRTAADAPSLTHYEPSTPTSLTQ